MKDRTSKDWRQRKPFEMRTIIFSLFMVLLSFNSGAKEPFPPEIKVGKGHRDGYEISKAVLVTMKIQQENDDLYAYVRFKNTLDRRICIYEKNLGWFESTPSFVVIRDRRGRYPTNRTLRISDHEIPTITSPLVRVTSVMAEGCVALFERGELAIIYSLHDNFDFPKYKRSYQAYYEGPGMPYYDAPEDEHLVYLRSSPVTFEYDNRPFWEKWID